ncbi:glutamate-gated chloride channel alpha isoform X2 [Procambarus clarkii]|uniref:glutamate-gated chloride channel alpha isoform X2 n=1 Tax=Procambarus clarkii TaxID=6728 RepID=UPI00374245CD
MGVATLCVLLFMRWCVEGGSAASVTRLLPKGYDITEEPHPPEGGPIVVGISWMIKNVYEVNFREMSVVLSMYFRMSWAEPRLVGVPQEGEGAGEGGMMPLHSDLTKHAWTPDLYFHEAQDIKSFKMIEEVQGVYLRPPNTFFFSTLLQVRLACPMYFSSYPFDVQVCPMTVTSYKFDEDSLQLEWMPELVSADLGVDDQMPNYAFSVEWTNVTTKYWCNNCSFAPSSMGQARIVLVRRYALHVLSVYVPSALFVAVAWASFFWPPDVIPGRTVLIITSLLTVISMYAAIGYKSPETSYVKAVDVWLFICIVMVVLTLFQYAVVITIQKREKEGKVSEVSPKNISVMCSHCLTEEVPATTATPSSAGPNSQGPAAMYAKGPRRPPSPHALVLQVWWVEWAGRLGVPIIFLFCNIVYWSIYLS